MQGVIGVPGGSVTNEDTSPGPVQTYLLGLGGAPGAFKSQLVATIAYNIYIYIHTYVTDRSTAFRRPWAFCHQRCIMDDFWNARANRTLFDVIFKAVNFLFWCIFSKTCISPRRTTIFDVFENSLFSKTSISPRRKYHFWGLRELSKYSTWHVLIPVLVTATLRVLPRTFADLDCLGTTPVPHEHILCHWRVHRRMPTVFVFQNHVSWQEILQRLPRPVQRLCAMLETPRNIFGPSDVKFFTWWTTLCTGIPRRSAANFQARFPSGQMMLEPVFLSRQPQTSMSFLRKFTWTLLHAPPHPPMCTKHHGLLKAVVQLI